MAGEIQDLTSTAASHARFAEGQAPSTLNDGARTVEGIISRWFLDTNYSVAATVSGSVIQMTANRTSITLTGTTSNYMADLLMAFTMGSVASPDGCYVNINGIGKIGLRSNNGTSLSASAIPVGTRALIIKDATNDYWRLLSPQAAIFSYQEGSWTPADASGAGLSLTINSATYTRIGRHVSVQYSITYPVTASGSSAAISGLPATNSVPNVSVMTVTYGTATVGTVGSGSTTMNLKNAATAAQIVNSTVSATNIQGSLALTV